MNARASAETGRLFTFTASAESCAWMTNHLMQLVGAARCAQQKKLIPWCALVPSLFWVPPIRVAQATFKQRESVSQSTI